MRSWAPCSVIAALVLVAACGGGGGVSGDRDLVVDFRYEGDSAVDIFASTVQMPVLNGLEGNRPTCSVVGGSMPPGLSIRSDCTIAGTATAAGVFTAEVQLTVSGFTGSVKSLVGFTVFAPTLAAAKTAGAPTGIDQVITVGTSVNRQALVVMSGYRPLAGDVLQFEVASGTLPAGVFFDSATGTITGTTGELASTAANITVNLRRNGQSYRAPVTRVTVAVSEPPLAIAYTPSGTFSVGDEVNMPPTVTSFVPAPGASIAYTSPAPLPPGLFIDEATGIITGRPTTPNAYTLQILASMRLPTGEVQTQLSDYFGLRVTGVFPFYSVSSLGRVADYPPPGDYPYIVHHVLKGGELIAIDPGTAYGGVAGDVLRYEMADDPVTGQASPPWVQVDPTSGRVTAQAPGVLGDGPLIGSRCGVRITLTRGGRTYSYVQGWLFGA